MNKIILVHPLNNFQSHCGMKIWPNETELEKISARMKTRYFPKGNDLNIKVLGEALG